MDDGDAEKEVSAACRSGDAASDESAPGSGTADRELVEACGRGDEAAWKELILRYRRVIYSVPVRFGMSRSEADEIFQRVVVDLFHDLGRLRRVDSLASWLMTTTRHACLGFLQQARRWDCLSSSEDARVAEQVDPIQQIQQRESEKKLAIALERLDDSCRELLYALYLEELRPPYQEIAVRRRCAVGSIGPSRARCLKKLRTLYRDLGGSGPW